MKRVTTLLPITRNDGTELAPAEQQALIERFWIAFGAVSVDGITSGWWIDTHSGQLYADRSLKVWVALEESQIDEMQQLVTQIGKELGQKAMYLEVVDAAVEIITIEE